jgi:hypothetical protein
MGPLGTRVALRPSLPYLPPVPEIVIGDGAGYHRLADRHGADADAGVVAALGDDVDILAAASIDGAA